MHLFFIKQISAKISSIQLIQGSFKLKQKHILKKMLTSLSECLKKKTGYYASWGDREELFPLSLSQLMWATITFVLKSKKKKMNQLFWVSASQGTRAHIHTEDERPAAAAAAAAAAEEEYLVSFSLREEELAIYLYFLLTWFFNFVRFSCRCWCQTFSAASFCSSQIERSKTSEIYWIMLLQKPLISHI